MRKTVLYMILLSALFSCADGIGVQETGGRISVEIMADVPVKSPTGLTPEEAQAFWPVYNQVETEKDEAMFAMIRAHKEMSKAIEEKKNEKEISALLDTYLEAQKKLNDIENGIAARYKAVLPVEKVAKLYAAEEKFRRQQIRKLHHGGDDGKPQPRN